MGSEFLFRWILNPLMKMILRSSLHKFASREQMLITFEGRKSGKKYTTPVGYIIDGDTVIVFTHARWWKNLVGGADVTLRIRGRDRDGRAEPVPDDVPRKVEGLRKFLVQVPGYARFYDVTLDDEGVPNPGDLTRAVESAVMIEIQLQGR